MATDNGLVEDLSVEEPADYGVLSPAATVVNDSSHDWTRRFDFPAFNCAANVRLSSLCTSATGVNVVEAEADAPLYRAYIPFTIETSFSCSTFAFRELEYLKMAEDFLEQTQQKAIEHELWTGALSQQEKDDWETAHSGETFPNRWLSSTDAVDVTPSGTAVKAKYGLALLEKALADCGAGIKGTIHMTRDIASVLNLKDRNGALRTSLGNLVIAGTGYTGTGPTGAAPSGTQTWLYATGPVSVRLGPVAAVPDKNTRLTGQSVNTSNNNVTVYASRPAAVTWDSCCLYAVKVDLALDYA